MSLKSIIFVVVGGLLGLWLAEEREPLGLVLGGLSAYLLHSVFSLSKRLHALEALQQGRPTEQGAVTSVAPPSPTPEPPQPRSAPSPATATAEAAQQLAQTQWAEKPERFTLASGETPSPAHGAPSPLENAFAAATAYIKGYFSDGNTMVRIGLLILFVGLGFLLKYASEHSLLPIELRLAGVFLLGIALLVVGWRLRLQRRGYALLLQGGAVGVMYLTVFASAKLYGLFPLPLALGVLIALVLASSLLALRQDAKSLAMFAAAGGFLAPVLTSSGGGSHVMLFSYYLLLNLGVLYIAWHKAWRELNLEAYLFTLVIGSLWGASAYGPEHFASTEPFLLCFFVMFVAISVLFAQRRETSLKDYVDATLVFGVPLAVFALQALMLRDTQYGLALTALGLGAFYVLLASALWRRHRQQLRLLTEAFVAIGVAFLTLAIPFAVDGRITAAAWALEGAGLLWVGVRQGRQLPLASGVALQLLAGLSFFRGSWQVAEQAMPFLHAIYLGGLLIAIAGLFSAYYLERHGKLRSVADIRIDLMLYLWGLLWWYGSGLHEISAHHGLWRMNEPMAMVLLLSLSTALLHLLARRYPWPTAVATLPYQIPALAILALILPLEEGGDVLGHVGYLVLPLAFIVHYHVLRQRESGMQGSQLEAQHMAISWSLIYLLCWQAYWLLSSKAVLNDTWATLAWGLIPALFALLILRLVRRMPWPFMAHAELYGSKVVSPLLLFTWLWCLFATGKLGDPAPLPFVPLLNPIELASLLLLLLGMLWLRGLQRRGVKLLLLFTPYQLALGLAATAFVWLNSLLARGVHYYAAVPYELEALFDSTAMQMALSITWTLVALAASYVAHRLAQRRLWLAAASLLGVVVLKLALVDLANSGTVERIVSFISVGLLMLVIGYVSPLPPPRQSGVNP